VIEEKRERVAEGLDLPGSLSIEKPVEGCHTVFQGVEAASQCLELYGLIVSAAEAKQVFVAQRGPITGLFR
jgi:hypothetical protein